jgi:hypothetical protein
VEGVLAARKLRRLRGFYELVPKMESIQEAGSNCKIVAAANVVPSAIKSATIVFATKYPTPAARAWFSSCLAMMSTFGLESLKGLLRLRARALSAALF